MRAGGRESVREHDRRTADKPRTETLGHHESQRRLVRRRPPASSSASRSSSWSMAPIVRRATARRSRAFPRPLGVESRTTRFRVPLEGGRPDQDSMKSSTHSKHQRGLRKASAQTPGHEEKLRPWCGGVMQESCETCGTCSRRRLPWFCVLDVDGRKSTTRPGRARSSYRPRTRLPIEERGLRMLGLTTCKPAVQVSNERRIWGRSKTSNISPPTMTAYG